MTVPSGMTVSEVVRVLTALVERGDGDLPLTVNGDGVSAVARIELVEGIVDHDYDKWMDEFDPNEQLQLRSDTRRVEMS